MTSFGQPQQAAPRSHSFHCTLCDRCTRRDLRWLHPSTESFRASSPPLHPAQDSRGSLCAMRPCQEMAPDGHRLVVSLGKMKLFLCPPSWSQVGPTWSSSSLPVSFTMGSRASKPFLSPAKWMLYTHLDTSHSYHMCLVNFLSQSTILSQLSCLQCLSQILRSSSPPPGLRLWFPFSCLHPLTILMLSVPHLELVACPIFYPFL